MATRHSKAENYRKPVLKADSETLSEEEKHLHCVATAAVDFAIAAATGRDYIRPMAMTLGGPVQTDLVRKRAAVIASLVAEDEEFDPVLLYHQREEASERDVVTQSRRLLALLRNAR